MGSFHPKPGPDPSKCASYLGSAATVTLMSALMSVERRVWVPAAAAAALLLVLAAVWAFRSDPPSGPSDGSKAAAPATDAPQALTQAKWQVKSFPARVGAKLSKSQKKAAEAEGDLAGTAVKTVIDAAFLERSALKGLGGKELAPGVEAAFDEARLGAPGGAKKVRITRRVAHIGIDPLTARRASAEVSVGFRAVVEGKPQRYLQRATLWLEKTNGKWQVIAFSGDRFDVEPKPDRKEKGSDKPGGKAGGKGDKGKDTKRKKGGRG